MGIAPTSLSRRRYRPRHQSLSTKDNSGRIATLEQREQVSQWIAARRRCPVTQRLKEFGKETVAGSGRAATEKSGPAAAARE
jgi:hypothetical protein